MTRILPYMNFGCFMRSPSAARPTRTSSSERTQTCRSGQSSAKSFSTPRFRDYLWMGQEVKPGCTWCQNGLCAVHVSAGFPNLPERQRPSKIDDEPFALAARTADHHALVLGLLFLGQDRVAVFRQPGNHPLFASAANSKFAGIVDVDAFIEQDFKD